MSAPHVFGIRPYAPVAPSDAVLERAAELYAAEYLAPSMYHPTAEEIARMAEQYPQVKRKWLYVLRIAEREVRE